MASNDRIAVVVWMTWEEAVAYRDREQNQFLNDFSEEDRLAEIASRATSKFDEACRAALARSEGEVWEGMEWFNVATNTRTVWNTRPWGTHACFPVLVVPDPGREGK